MVLVVEDRIFERYILDTGLLVENRYGPISRDFADQSLRFPAAARLALARGTRVYVDESGGGCFSFSPGEPSFQRLPNAVRVESIDRLVRVQGEIWIVWALLRLLDGNRSHTEMMESLESWQREPVERLLRDLVCVGCIDLPSQPAGRAIHSMTKQGVLPAGGLTEDDILRLVTDGEHRAYPEALQLSLDRDIPAALAPLNQVIRARRSSRDFNGTAISRKQLDAMLHAACGPTGEMNWDGKRVQLRAYPSGGALYAVEIYVVSFCVKGLENGLYHYRPNEHRLEFIQGKALCDMVLDATLPSEREMLGGVGVMICLTGFFSRHERKYGQGGYRMLVAEAGHISQNLLLSATALGLDSRPFGGVFDEMINCAFKLEAGTEEFLLSVLIGHAGERTDASLL